MNHRMKLSIAKLDRSVDGKGFDARLHGPIGIAVSPDGDLFFSDRMNHQIRKVTPDGTVMTLCGFPAKIGSEVGKGLSAQFSFPGGIACSPNGTIYVLDSGNSTVRKVT